jgi:hypothetical protein
MAGKRGKSFASGLWEATNLVMCFGGGGGGGMRVWKSDSESEGGERDG